MQEIVTIGSANCRKVASWVLANWRKDTRRISAVRIAAARQAVPAALSQFNSYTAASSEGLAVTAGMRVIALCSPGTRRPFNTVAHLGRYAGHRLSVQRFIAAFIVGAPKTST